MRSHGVLGSIGWRPPGGRLADARAESRAAQARAIGEARSSRESSSTDHQLSSHAQSIELLKQCHHRREEMAAQTHECISGTRTIDGTELRAQLETWLLQ